MRSRNLSENTEQRNKFRNNGNSAGGGKLRGRRPGSESKLSQTRSEHLAGFRAAAESAISSESIMTILIALWYIPGR